ncbi:hypothetical protein SAMN05216496_1306 [Pseudomonas sp. Z003-0.4C(8344-21)]|uniref:hypothetical protein n=1 Tax=Pseudomonas sp. Z003-0.4C(8344-21) TaxID=1855380 RepID=UPI00087A46B1|nr:hypothetical protein [Pseudomonas sp. Z003-0.4C(8344-21)]SDS31679.1 hypothetical protein SAMN05216496_1306 [Pseudomonas sp. Z003-0.4C(8344-21)]
MQRIYEPASLMEGEMLKGMLASEGIEAHLIGRELITAYNAALPLPGDEPESYPGTLVC